MIFLQNGGDSRRLFLFIKALDKTGRYLYNINVVNYGRATALAYGGIKMFEKVKELLVEELSVDEDQITPSAELVNDLGINSLELADLVMLCEERFGVTIDDDDAQGFVTVDDVVEYLTDKAE